MKIDLEAFFKDGLVNGADDVVRLTAESAGESTGFCFFDKDKVVYIANDFEDKKQIIEVSKSLVDVIVQKVLEDVSEILLDKLDTAFATNAVNGAPLDPLWATKSTEIRNNITQAKDALSDIKDEYQSVEDSLK